MSIFIIYLLVAFLDSSKSKWTAQFQQLSENKKFTQATGAQAYYSSGYFMLPSLDTTANFITCTAPATSYITLNNTYPSTRSSYYYYVMDGDYVAIDLFFQGVINDISIIHTWSSKNVLFTIGSFTYSYTYTSPLTYPTTGFCDDLTFEVKTVNFTTGLDFSGNLNFTSSIINSGQVSIRNFIVSRLKCYPSCKKCTGPKFDECTSCYYELPTNNICPPCPSNQYYMKNNGCKDICGIHSPLYSDRFCQEYPISSIEYVFIFGSINDVYNLKWSLIYDQEHLDTSINIHQYIYGVFKYNSGIYRQLNQLSTFTYATYLIGMRIQIVTYNDIPINCGIQFKINNTYFGSIYRNASGIQTHKLKIFSTTPFNSYLTYSVTRYELITYVDIPKYPFLFSATGNYTDGTAGWGMYQIETTSGYCTQYCSLCEVSFKCKTCLSGYYFYRDGSCIDSCSYPYQRLNGSYCYDYDDETPYSYYLIQEYTDAATDPGQYAQYTLISQNGDNFLKGSDIYYSYQNGIRVFGGPFVWAQAKFQRIHNIISPHHSVTIAFYILYGPSFPLNGQFIYRIETNAPVSKQIASGYYNSDQSRYDKVYERIDHNINTLTITWECFGPNNEPIKAYCGFYNYYIAVHNCQPYCLQCSDQSTCTLWNSTYDANIVKFSQAECLINQYYDKDSVRCLTCPLSCLTCTSKIDCQTCQSTYTQTKLGCICKVNQYEGLNQCFDCPIECNQCLSSTYCIECLNSNYRQLSNGQCNCMNGYYPIVSNPQCQVCHQFCKTCVGPTFDECLTCNDILSIEQVGGTCRCPSGTSYQDALKTCSSCHFSCQTCFKTTNDGCLTCNPTLYRILKGLKCVCEPGYYEISNICTNCPNTEDSSLSQCYKLCNNNQQLWHTITCNSCDIGFQLVSGDCQPFCGDSQIKAYEQCEDNNTILNDLCYNCQFQCPAHCLTCDQSTTLPCPDVCGDGIISGIEECEDGNTIQYDGCFNCKYQCQLPCTKCILGKCFECATGGWYIDLTVSPWQCKERCGDMQIIGDEQCEDGNLIDTDGCKDCRYFCRIGCFSCDYTTNTCLSCQLPGFVPTSYYCKNVCGDGLVVTDPSGFFTEQCDDGNTINYDGCSSGCQFQCQASTICLSCISNRCQSCATGYSLSINKICIPICEDSMLVASEQCEDSFRLPYKGCQNCQAKCQNSCLNCSTTGLGCLSCKSGYNKIDYLCYSICGDNIITEDEQCDDANLIIGDGCHFCLFSCQDSCLNCIKGVCYDCQEGYELIQSKCYSICGDGVQKYNEQCEIISSLQTYKSCKFCQISCDLNCYLCQFGMCQQCNNGYELSSNQQYCVKSLQNNSIVIENCQLQIGSSCIKCENYAYFEKVEQRCNLKIAALSFCEYYLKLSPDLYCSQCFDYCASCNEKNCITCQSGYYLDGNLSCISSCGDGILAHDEQCELYDQNCLSCMFQDLYYESIFCQVGYLDLITNTCIIVYNMNKCSKNCQECFFQQCLECEFGYYGNKCMPKCGDGIIVQEEECDDGNLYDLDTCLNCKYQCPQYCELCAYGVCTQCYNGFYLDIVSNSCNSFCGDSILANDEVCDDGNELRYDGCFQCMYQCQMECLDCQFGKCILCESPLIMKPKGICEQIKQCQNEIGLYYDNQSNDCLSLCGDGIVAGDEQCDDENSFPYDGCFECKYQCIRNCQVCQETICLQCDQDYSLNNNQCSLNKQNDLNSSIIEKPQNNDKNNDKKNDTSINIQNPQFLPLTEDTLCRGSECVISKKPNMQLTYKSQYYALQYVEITFDQEVKFQQQVLKHQNLFNISIYDLDSKNYNITINSIQDISFNLQYAQYQVVIEIFQSLSTKPVLLVQLNHEIINSNNQTLFDLSQSITLLPSKVISKQITQVSNYAQQSNKAFMIGAISLCVISFFSGESQIVVETLNLLQYQSFLRFINVDYPENLQIYFQAQELLSITSYLQLFQIDDYLNLITRKEKQIYLSGKFQKHNIEADLFTNILPQLIQFLGLLALIFFGKNLYYIIFNLIKYMRLIQYQESLLSKVLFSTIKLILFLRSCIKSLMKIRYLQNYDQIIQIIYINSWDLIFKVILQLYYNRIDNLRSILTTLFATSIFFLYTAFLIKSLSVCNHVKKKNVTAKLEIKFITLDICRTMFFHIVLILFQEQQILQCLLISVSSITQCYLIYKYKQCSKLEKIIYLIIEGVLTIFSVSLFLYLDIGLIQISYQNKVNLGFIQMIVLILSLAIVFVKQLYPKIQNVYKLICQKKQMKVAISKLFL